MSNHLQMSSQRQHILLSYFKTLSVGPVWARTRDLPHRSPALYELTGRRLAQWILFQLISVEGSSEMKPALRFFFQSLPSGCLSYKKFNFEIKVRGPPTRLGAPARNNFLRLLFTWSIFVLQKESHCSVQTLKKKKWEVTIILYQKMTIFLSGEPSHTEKYPPWNAQCNTSFYQARCQ